MIVRALDSNGDWTFGSGVANYAFGERAIEFNISMRLRSWRNDCFFDFDAGIDWTARLDKGQRDTLVNDIKILLIQTYGVTKINSVSLSEVPRTRRLNLTYDIATIFSPSFTSTIPLTTDEVGS